jgi:hypothetical protein
MRLGLVRRLRRVRSGSPCEAAILGGPPVGAQHFCFGGRGGRLAVGMSLSSGVHVTEVVAMRDCDCCGFHGFVDAWADPETRTGGWECPDCHLQHVNNY